MPRLAAPALLIACLVLVLAACGGSAAAQPSDGPATGAPAETLPAETAAAEPEAPVAGTDLDACELVTAEDIAAAAKVDAADVPAGELELTPTSLSPGHTECTYVWETGRVIVALTPEDGANLYDAARGSYDDASDISGSGGDGAFYSKDNNRAFFWKGSVTVMFTMFLSDSDDMRPFAEEAGKLALAKV